MAPISCGGSVRANCAACGLATRVRRLRGRYDETNEADMSEYHVVRQGVDEVTLQKLLEPAFHDVEVQCYRSTQSGALQALGERFGPATTFGLFARNPR
ncbi:hypothetical protein ACFVYV_15335 [Streptomyces mirabilis]|uniref:hypothetical protein n=1 Tax=Streptomyces mirabilis TaxID=68239 RepID=UPI0036DBADB9